MKKVSAKVCTELVDLSNLPIAKIAGQPGVDDKAELTRVTHCNWNKSVLSVRFIGGVATVIEQVKKYADEWSKYANVRFNYVNAGLADIRIAFEPDDSWSYVGRCIPPSFTQNDPTMNFGWLTPSSSDEEYSRVVLHEFGHALGFAHEHQHPTSPIPWDVQATYDYYMRTQKWTKKEVDKYIFAKYSTQLTNFSAYDSTSIMHYAIPNELTIGNFSTPWNTSLSNLDKEYASRWYPYYIASLSRGKFSQKLLGMNPSSGQLLMVSDHNYPGAGWQIVKDNDLVQFRSVADGPFFGQYLDVSTTSGKVKIHDDNKHSGTLWRIVNEGSHEAIISASSGKYNGKRLTVSTTKGTIWMEGAASHTGTRWQIG